MLWFKSSMNVSLTIYLLAFFFLHSGLYNRGICSIIKLKALILMLCYYRVCRSHKLIHVRFPPSYLQLGHILATSPKQNQ